MSVPIKNNIIYPLVLDLNNKKLLLDLCKSSYSIAEVLKKSGRLPTGGNYQQVKRKIAEFEIDTSHFTGRLWSKGKTYDQDHRISKVYKYDSDDKILGYHPEISRKQVKKYILDNNKIPYVCAICGNTGVWNGSEITLELDHINGDPYDHSINNLRFLCPNCHATTPTFVNRKRSSNKL